jgi:hypothetical protein
MINLIKSIIICRLFYFKASEYKGGKSMKELDKILKNIIEKYQDSFKSKEYGEENNDSDLLMEIFNITPEIKRENRQYWGRELGMLFELVCTEIFKSSKGFQPKEKMGADSPYDFIYENMAIDTKYRIGSGDSGTLKKFKKYAEDLKNLGYIPVILLFRDDSLPAAITACTTGGWTLFTAKECFEFIIRETGFDLKKFLIDNKSKFNISKK